MRVGEYVRYWLYVYSFRDRRTHTQKVLDALQDSFARSVNLATRPPRETPREICWECLHRTVAHSDRPGAGCLHTACLCVVPLAVLIRREDVWQNDWDDASSRLRSQLGMT